MEYRLLGRTGVHVSSLCFGTMSFGGDADEATSAAMYARCRDAGINFFDCANAYGGGRAEEILGKLMAGERDELVITSKVGFRMREGLNGEGCRAATSCARWRTACAASAPTASTSTLPTASTPTRRSRRRWRRFDDLVRAGKILYPAVSNWAAWQVAKALGICERHGWAKFAVMQPMYNLVKRQAEVEILPLALSEGLGVIPYSPLGGGLLSGKYGVGVRPESGPPRRKRRVPEALRRCLPLGDGRPL